MVDSRLCRLLFDWRNGSNGDEAYAVRGLQSAQTLISQTEKRGWRHARNPGGEIIPTDHQPRIANNHPPLYTSAKIPIAELLAAESILHSCKSYFFFAISDSSACPYHRAARTLVQTSSLNQSRRFHDDMNPILYTKAIL